KKPRDAGEKTASEEWSRGTGNDPLPLLSCLFVHLGRRCMRLIEYEDVAEIAEYDNRFAVRHIRGAHRLISTTRTCNMMGFVIEEDDRCFVGHFVRLLPSVSQGVTETPCNN